MSSDLLSEREAAELLGTSRDVLEMRRLQRRSRLPYVLRGGEVFYSREIVLAYLQEQERAACMAGMDSQ
jgi:superfamily I DNA/RNA helicase